MNAPFEIANALTVDVEDYFQVFALAAHTAGGLGAHTVPGGAQRGGDPLALRRRASSGDVLYPRLDRGAHPGLVRDRRRRPRAGEPRLRAPAHPRADRGRIHAGHPPRQGPARGYHRRGGERATARRASPSASERCGPSSASRRPATGTARACTRCATTCTACPMRRASLPAARRSARNPGDDGAVLNRNLPAGGGGYFRLLPYAVSRALIRRVNEVDRRPGVFYFHPWEIDPAQPGCRARASRPGFATTSICAGPSRGFGACCATSLAQDGRGLPRPGIGRRPHPCPPGHDALRGLAPSPVGCARPTRPGRGRRAVGGAAARTEDTERGRQGGSGRRRRRDRAGLYAGDAAVWTQNRLTIRGRGGRAHLRADGARAEDKGIWVVKGSATTIENIEFSGAKVPDRNGAGIRLEGPGLTVRTATSATTRTASWPAATSKAISSSSIPSSTAMAPATGKATTFTSAPCAASRCATATATMRSSATT